MAPSFTSKRAIVTLVIFFCAAALVCAGIFLYRWHQLPPEAAIGPSLDILSDLPPDAPVIAYIDEDELKKLQDSALSAMLGLAGADAAKDREYAQFVDDTGFDYARDLDRVALAFWPADLEPSPKGVVENRVLAIADGRFAEQKIKAYALRTGKLVIRESRAIYEVPGDPAVSFEFISRRRIALASGGNADDLVDLPGSRHDGPAIRARIEHVAGAPIFAVARTQNLPASFFSIFRGSPQLERLARSVQNLTLAGRPDANQIQATLDAQCGSVKDAFELATLLDGARILGTVAMSDPKTRKQMTKEEAALLSALIDDAQVSHENTWVRLKLDITPAMLGEPNAGAPAEKSPVPVRSTQ